MFPRLEELARETARLVRTSGARLVLAESCTAGLVASLLVREPGASEWFCGSAVTYRDETKIAWLDIQAGLLGDPGAGPVSAPTAAAMCAGVLAITSEADLAASVTGHLGPDAPAELDGAVFVGLEARAPGRPARVASFRLAAELPEGSRCPTLRLYRQHEAAACLLDELRSWLDAPSPAAKSPGAR